MNDCTTECTGACNQGRSCEASHRATQEAIGPGLLLLIVPSLVVIVSQVAPLFRW